MRYKRDELSPEEMKEVYFEFQSVMGVTKHMGGLKATRELIESCCIDEGKCVLEVGCALGRTSCYIAKGHGCRVVGVDISEMMIDRSKERAKREDVEDRVEFRVADAQSLPFEDATFDAVIGESVIAFLEDNQRAVCECVRVSKQGGYVGLNERIWIKAPPLGLAEYLYRTTGAKLETSDVWKELLEGSGLTDVVVRTYKINALSQWAGEIRQLGFEDTLYKSMA